VRAVKVRGSHDVEDENRQCLRRQFDDALGHGIGRRANHCEALLSHDNSSLSECRRNLGECLKGLEPATSKRWRKKRTMKGRGHAYSIAKKTTLLLEKKLLVSFFKWKNTEPVMSAMMTFEPVCQTALSCEIKGFLFLPGHKR
jgi:hypothetical protein